MPNISIQALQKKITSGEIKLPKMILFDYGGTLLHEPGCDFPRGEREVFKHVIKNPKALTSDDISAFETAYYQSLQAVRDLHYEAHELQMLKYKYEANGIELDVSYEEAERILWDSTSPMIPECILPHVPRLLETLHIKQLRSAVVSNIGWSGNALRRRIDTLLPDNPFEFIIASSEYGVRKPDRRIFELALNKAQLAPEDAWFCGDWFEMDIIGAHSAGIYPIYYQGESQTLKREPKALNADFDYTTIYDWSDFIDIF
ncbi:MAG: HAD family hydrolase [Lachnospiraceae bacterium]|nr:HAD family hydrolase [Lachnospiraceae bacterium]